MLRFWRRAEEPAENTDRVPDRSAWTVVPRWRLAAVLLLALVNASLSGLLLLQHHGHSRAVAVAAQLCGEGAQSGCETVARSPYSEVRGVPVAAAGLAFAVSLALLSLLGVLGGPDTRTTAAAVALVALLLAALAAVVLLGVQVFLIKAFCRLCLLTYVVNALALFVLLPARREGAALVHGIRYAEGRVAMAGWAFGTLAAAGAVLALEMALDARGRTAAASASSPLGLPAAGANAAAAPAAGSDAARYQEEARLAQEQARRLQEILDDPHKLEEYFAQKATREFEQGPVHDFNLGATPAKGPAEAPIRVVEFSDFLCPYCRSIASAFAQYVPQSGNRVVLYFKNYPLEQSCNPNLKSTIHPGACALALGAICAQEQGRFWPYHDRVFADPPKAPSVKDVAALAEKAGLDAAALEACMTGTGAPQKLAAEIREAKTSGVDSTPTLFVNGRRLPRLNDFVQTVDREAAKMGLPPLPPPAGPRPHSP